MARSNDDESSAQVGCWQARQKKNIARSSLHKFTDHGDVLHSVTAYGGTGPGYRDFFNLFMRT